MLSKIVVFGVSLLFSLSFWVFVDGVFLVFACSGNL